MAGVPTPNTVDVTRLGKHSNGSASSLVGPGTSISSASGFLAHRKGSLASLKNAFMKGGSAPAGINSPIPPVPALDGKHTGNAGYPALKNPFSRFDAPISPTSSTFRPSSRRNGDTSPAPSGHRGWAQSKHSTTTNHSSHRSHGGRSATSQGSSSFQVEDHPLPALPPIPMRGTPSRMGRTESDAGSFLRNASISGDGEESVVKTPAEEGLRVVFRQFSEAANQKIARICARPLVCIHHPELFA